MAQTMPDTQHKVLVLLSGGLDSAVLLATAVNSGYQTKAVTFTYGQRHNKEVDAARMLAEFYKVEWLHIDLSDLFALDKASTLLHGTDAPVPHTPYARGMVPSTYVPFRNGLFLSVAASLAMQLECSEVHIATHNDDFGAAYPDTSSEFIAQMDTAIRLGTAGAVGLVAPFSRMTKKGIVTYGKQFKVPFAMTWSCYEGGDNPCGKCATCIDRAKAMEANGINEAEDFQNG